MRGLSRRSSSSAKNREIKLTAPVQKFLMRLLSKEHSRPRLRGSKMHSRRKARFAKSSFRLTTLRVKTSKMKQWRMYATSTALFSSSIELRQLRSIFFVEQRLKRCRSSLILPSFFLRFLTCFINKGKLMCWWRFLMITVQPILSILFIENFEGG